MRDRKILQTSEVAKKIKRLDRQSGMRRRSVKGKRKRSKNKLPRMREIKWNTL
jgi:hypothetical protein